MNIVVLYRQTQDWLNHEINSSNILHGVTVSDINQWEKVFNTKYTSYRNQLKNISSQLLGKYQIQTLSDWLDDHSNMNDDDIIIPCDDDDWLHPNIIDFLPADSDVFFWHSYVLNLAKQCRFNSWHSDTCNPGTISYAIKYSAWKKLKDQYKIRFLTDHYRSFYIPLVENIRCTFIQQHLGVYLWHFGSSSIIKNTPKKKRLRPRFSSWPELPNEIHWAANQYKELIDTISAMYMIKMMSVPVLDGIIHPF